MTDPVQQTRKSTVTVRLRELVRDISIIIDDAPEDEKIELLSLLQSQRLLSFLRNWRRRDRRSAPRKPCSMAVTFATQDRVFKDFVRNISAAGVFIETPEALSVGQEITLIFSSPNSLGPVKITGKVVWRVPKGIGVKFTRASNDLEAIIESL